jgi:quinol monooxygenase YgiN
MIHEIVIQHVQPERRDEYIKAFGEFLRNASYAGSHGIRFFVSIEDPGRVILMVDWDTVEAHAQIRGTPTYNAMRELAGKYQTAKSDGGHYLLHEVKS